MLVRLLRMIPAIFFFRDEVLSLEDCPGFLSLYQTILWAKFKKARKQPAPT
jgi:hypothetical protein